MKKLKQILEESDTLKVRENINGKELVEMVELGLLEKEKLGLLERAMKIDAELMTEAEKNVIVDLLNSLIAERISVQKPFITPGISGSNARTSSNYIGDENVPVIITFRRKSIRVFPDSIKIALYYSPQLDKYISIPFGEKSAEITRSDIRKSSKMLGGGSHVNEEVLDERRKSTKERNTYSVDHSDDDEDRQEIAQVGKAFGPEAARAHAKNVRADRRQAVRNLALSRAKTNRELSRLPGGVGEAARRARARGGQYSALSADIAGAGATAVVGVQKAAHRLSKTAAASKAKEYAKSMRQKILDKTSEWEKGSVNETFENNLNEARRSARPKVKKPKVIKNRAKVSRRKPTGKTKSLKGIKIHLSPKPKVKKVRKKATKPTSKAPVSTKKTEAKPSIHHDAYTKAKRSYDSATPRTVEVWDPNKRQKVTVSAKEHYRKIMNHHAAQIRAGGGSLPHVEGRKKPKRTPGIKAPPALAEQNANDTFLDRWVPGWKKSKEKAIEKAKQPLSQHLKDFAKEIPSTVLSGIASTKGAGMAAKAAKGIGTAAAGAAVGAAAKKELARKKTKDLLKGAKDRLKARRQKRWDNIKGRAKAGAVGAAAGAAASGDNNPHRDDEANRRERDNLGATDRFTARPPEQTVGTGQVVGSKRATDDRSIAHDTMRAYTPPGSGKKNRSAGGGVDVQHVNESNLDIIRKLVESKEGGKTEVYFDGNPVTINSRVARKVLAIYESLNRTNKKNMEKMLNESVSSFRKAINFSIRQ